MIKRTSRKIAAHIYWIAATFIFLALIAIPLLPRALGQAGNKTAPNQAALPAYNPAITSQTATVPGVRSIPILMPPNFPRTILYNQYNNLGPNATSSQDFELEFNVFSDELANDFIVRDDETWSVESIDVDGMYFNGTGPVESFNVRFYADGVGLPGAMAEERIAMPYTVTGSTFSVAITPPVHLDSGTYWVSVEARMDFALGGQWGWSDRAVQAGNGAAWQNPDGGFAGGQTWAPKTMSVPTTYPDQVYRLNGTIEGATPRPTPTPRPRPTPHPRPTPPGTPTPPPSPTPTPTGTTVVPRNLRRPLQLRQQPQLRPRRQRR